MGKLEALISNTITLARQSTYDLGGYEAGKLLVALNLAHTGLARWEPVYALLSEPLVGDDDVSGCCRLLAHDADSLPAEVRAKLLPITTALTTRAPQQLAPNLLPSAKGAARALAARLSQADNVTDTAIGSLLAGDADQREWAARLALRRAAGEGAGMLMVMCHDAVPRVRATASACLARLLATDGLAPGPLGVLYDSLKDPGTLVPRAVAGELSRHQPTSETESIRRTLATNVSARARAAAAR
ncbi:hypothetical protein [Amycolatopsis tolypomycina]|uniref:hypothetical protein n=1 Tax=Amycolatopsis tolypomycina TaxID=208445 RepID=UPI00115FDC42|nr:hypothetical protein [Amycolatopsis tolypomycina]